MSDRISRGEVISLLAGIPVVVGVVGGVAEAADSPQAVQLKKSLGYVPKSTKAGQQCSGCNFYIPGKTAAAGGCKIIPGGTVAAKGWCKSWTKKA